MIPSRIIPLLRPSFLSPVVVSTFVIGNRARTPNTWEKTSGKRLTHADSHPREWDSFYQSLDDGCIDEAMTEVTRQVEDFLYAALSQEARPQPKAYLGRAKPKLVQLPANPPVVWGGHPGDFQSALDDAPVRFRQQVRQIRRLQTVIGQLDSAAFGSTGAQAAALETWDSILSSPSFEGGYQAYVWENIGIPLPDAVDPSHVPFPSVQKPTDQPCVT